jgi:hypothetical protein
MAYRAEVFHTFDADLNRSDLKGFCDGHQPIYLDRG